MTTSQPNGASAGNNGHHQNGSGQVPFSAPAALHTHTIPRRSSTDTVQYHDVLYDNISFSRRLPADALVLDLLQESRFVMRMRNINQYSSASYTHNAPATRFEHSIGATHLMKEALIALRQNSHKRMHPQIDEFQSPLMAAALLHDLCHLAPGSHLAFSMWFPDDKDRHEDLTVRVISQDEEIQSVFARHGKEIGTRVEEIMLGSTQVPSWTWQLLLGSGWNIDRSDFVPRDRLICGIQPDRYVVSPILNNLLINEAGQLALRDQALPQLLEFMHWRATLYQDLYLIPEGCMRNFLHCSLARRAREIKEDLNFCTDVMHEVLSAKSAMELSCDTIYELQEGLVQCHIAAWDKNTESDEILRDLAQRIRSSSRYTIHDVTNQNAMRLYSHIQDKLVQAGYDPQYYLGAHLLRDYTSSDVQHSLPIGLADGRTVPLSSVAPYLEESLKLGANAKRHLLFYPTNIKP